MVKRLTTCCIPLCKRYTRRFEEETQWICGEHWMSVPAKARRLYALTKRRYRRFGFNFWQYPAGSPMRLAAAKAQRQNRAAWNIVVKQATRRAFP